MSTGRKAWSNERPAGRRSRGSVNPRASEQQRPAGHALSAHRENERPGNYPGLCCWSDLGRQPAFCTAAPSPATGHLGRLVIASLLNKTPSSDIIATVRNEEKAKDLAASGVQMRIADKKDNQVFLCDFNKFKL